MIKFIKQLFCKHDYNLGLVDKIKWYSDIDGEYYGDSKYSI